MTIMVLGVCNISDNIAYSKTETVSDTEVNQSELKANKETLEKAETLMANKDFQSAIVHLTAYISNKPKRYEAYKLRGDSFYALHQFRLAEADYQKAISLKTDDDKFITGTKVLSAVVLGADKQSQYQNPELGNLYGRLMYAQKALNNPAYESTYDKAFEFNSHIYLPKPKKEEISKINCPQKYGKLLNPQGVDEYISDAIAKIEDGQFSEAVYKIQYVTANYPKYYFGHYLMGVAMAGLEQFDDAVHSFETSLKYNPYDFESFASLGQLYYERAEKTFSSDDATKSIEYFNKAVKYNPNCHIYNYYIGLNQMIIGDYGLAISSFNSAIKLKSNDYNSIYYKLVALHIKGDYISVIDGTTSLLYRHVSNYNSVLYLRALAYYKSGKSDLALSDLDKIHNNMNDIYNADVKPLSKKEQTLSHYLYYLKAEILQDLGLGVKADLEKAFQNPVIAELSSGNVSSDFVLTPKQVDTEYDYIRTTFTDLNVSFEYLNPNYKIVALSPVLKQEIGTPFEAENGLKLSTNPIDTLPSDEKMSLAQMLASQSFGSVSKNVSPIEYNDVVTTVQLSESPENIVAEQTSQITDDKNLKNDDSLLSSDEVAKPVVITDFEQQKTETNIASNNEFKEITRLVADEKDSIPEVEPVKTTPLQNEEVVEDVEIQSEPEKLVDETTHETSKVEEVLDATVSEQNEQVQEEVSKVDDFVEVAEPVKNVPDVVEKHAQVNLDEFNTVQNRKVLVLKEDDEIIEFQPENLSEKFENQLPQVITPVTSSDSNKITEEIVKNQKLTGDEVQQKVDKLEEVSESNSVDMNITPTEVTTTLSDVQEVEISETEIKKEDVKFSENSEVNAAADIEEKISEDVQREVDISADKAFNDIVEAEKSAVEQNTSVEETVEKTKKSWFGWFKRDKKDNSIGLDEVSDDIVDEVTTIDDIISDNNENVWDDEEKSVIEPENIEEKTKVKEIQQNPAKTDVVVENKNEQKVEITQIEEQKEQKNVSVNETKSEDSSEQSVGNSDIPLIRTKKAEIEELEDDVEEDIEINYEKKKFVWWWNRTKSEASQNTVQSEENVTSKRFDWKKFFTHERKSKEAESVIDTSVQEDEQISE